MEDARRIYEIWSMEDAWRIYEIWRMHGGFMKYVRSERRRIDRIQEWPLT